MGDLETKATEESSCKNMGELEQSQDDKVPPKEWTPIQANYPEEDETYPFLRSVTTMRGIKAYVNDENLMPTTTYSFIVTTRAGNVTNLVNIFVFTLQAASYAAVTASIFDASNTINPCQFPANVTSPVRASQLLSLMYSILVQDSIVKSLYTFRNGYDEAELRRCFPECARKGLKVRWYFALSFILCLGCYAQFLTFIMIMQSKDVLSVLLNYAAVSFIATIDDRVFYLGKRGWLGERVEKNVRLVALADDVKPKPVWYRQVAHTIAMLCLFGALLGLWVWVVASQTSGSYLARSLRVDFGDLVHPSLGTFSGRYDIVLEKTRVFSTSHSIYFETNSQRSFFGYCPDVDAWTFSYNVSGSDYNACKWDAKSATTVEFDILTTTTSQWFAGNPDGRTVPMDTMIILASDCETNENFCGEHGTCIEGSCECDKGYFGSQCSFPEPCSHLEVDGRLDSFQGNNRKWSNKFKILRFGNDTATTYGQPVYVTKREPRENPILDRSNENDFDIIFYTGRRWALAFSKSFHDPEFDEDLESYLASFHAHFADYEVAFLSEPIDSIKANPSPHGLSWFIAEPKVGTGIQAASPQKSSAVLLCTECNNSSNPCFYDGICDEDGACECSEGSEGGLCEVAPIGNGKCDPFYNTIEFDLDGGDCCRATCLSSGGTICGKDPTGFLDTGFFFCNIEDPLPSETIHGEPFSEAGRIVALSDNAYVMAAVMADGEVGLFDKEGSQWKERAIIGNCPVQAIAMASGPFASNPIFVPPVVIVISCKGSTLVEAYYCTESGCSDQNLQAPPNADRDLFGNSVGIGSDGDVIAVSSQGDVDTSGFVDILRAERGSGGSVVWGRNDELITPNKQFQDDEDTSNSPSIQNTSSPSVSPYTQAPVADRGLIVFEAEDATLVNAEIETRYTPFSGDGYVNMNGPDSRIEWDVADLEGGIYEVSASYASGSNRPAYFLVDGARVETFDFEATSSWSDWTLESKALELNAGNHTLMISAEESTGPNIDFLVLHLTPPTDAPSVSAIPSTLPTAEPSIAPSTPPTKVPNQIVVAMSLSGSGDTLAMVVGDIVDGLSVRVHIFRYDGATWEEPGSPIEGTVCSIDISTRDMIRLSHDGNTLLFSTGNSLRVLDWDDHAKQWGQRGTQLPREEALPGEAFLPQCIIDTVTLSADGSAVAINLFLGGATGIQHVATFAWTGSRWEQREQNSLRGSPEGPLALSSDGRELAVGLPLVSADLSGAIQTYEYPRRPCGSGYSGFRITFTLKPEITKWSLKIVTRDQDTVSMEGGPYFFPNFEEAKAASQTHHDLATIVEEICLPTERLCTNLTVWPTDFGGFNVVENGVLVFFQESVDYPVSWVDDEECQ